MIIVAGYIRTKPGSRDAFIEKSVGAMKAARQLTDCMEFAVAPDPVDPDRVIVYEAWTNENALENFRGEGPDADFSALIETVSVQRHHVSHSGPA